MRNLRYNTRKLRPQDAEMIRDMYSRLKLNMRQIAYYFDISINTIFRIVHNKTYTGNPVVVRRPGKPRKKKIKKVVPAKVVNMPKRTVDDIELPDVVIINGIKKESWYHKVYCRGEK